MIRGRIFATSIIITASATLAMGDDFRDPHPFRKPQLNVSSAREAKRDTPVLPSEQPGAPLSTAFDDVTSSAQAEHQNSSTVMFRVNYKREGVQQTRMFLIPRDLAAKMNGGLIGTLEVKSLVLSSNGEPKQLIIQEQREGKKTHEVEFQVGWNSSGKSCTLVVQASSELTRQELGLPVEDSDCHHYIFNPDQGSRELASS